MTVIGTKTATLLPTVFNEMRGNAKHYRLDPPYVGPDLDTDEELTVEYVVVSDAPKTDNTMLVLLSLLAGYPEPQDATTVFVATADGLGEVETVEDIPAVIFDGQGWRDQARALAELGYEIVSAE